MNRNRSKKSKNSQIPLFIQKLLEMVENKQIQSIISWTHTRDSFNIKNVSKFTDEVLPRYFKHQNFSSFIRQLNMYGFRKIRHADGQNVYINENFRQGNRALLKNITRRIREDREDRVAIYQNYNDASPLMGRQLQEIKSKQKNLQEVCKHLLLQNQKLMEQNSNIMKKMKEESLEKQKRLEQLLLTLVMNQKNQSISNGQNQQLLSITNDNADLMKSMENHPDQTPLELLSKSIDSNSQLKRYRQAITSACTPYIPPKRNSKNYTIVSPKPQEEKPIILSNEHLEPNEHDFSNQMQNQPNDFFDQNKNDHSFLSINDFINADDYDKSINLEESL